MDMHSIQLWFLYLCLAVLFFGMFFCAYKLGVITAQQFSTNCRLIDYQTRKKYLVIGGIIGVLFLMATMVLTFIYI